MLNFTLLRMSRKQHQHLVYVSVAKKNIGDNLFFSFSLFHKSSPDVLRVLLVTFRNDAAFTRCSHKKEQNGEKKHSLKC